MAKKTSMFASLEGLPTTMGGGKAYPKMKPISEGVNLPASDTDREFKKAYDTEAMDIDTKGFTIFISLDTDKDSDTGMLGGNTPPTTYFKFTIGETPTFSFYFGDDAPSYNMVIPTTKVSTILIDRKKNLVSVKMDDDSVLEVKNSNMSWTFADKNATNGYFYEKSYNMMIGVQPYNLTTATLFREKKDELENLIPELEKDGMGMYLWTIDSAKTYFSPQSFTFDKDLDKEFLRTADVNYDSLNAIDTTKSYISFTVAVENKAKRTNNFTGKHGSDSSYLVSLQFPGDEELLAPMGVGDDGTTVACGMESPAGRVLKSIKPVVKNGNVEQVEMKFQDGSYYIFPDAETGLFTATDKQFPDQMLEGKVVNLIVGAGSPNEAHAKEVATRLENDVDTSRTIFIDGKPQTKAIAWTTINPSTMKVIVPNPDGKGSKLITIPLTKEA
jgi:hypothetical protein